MELLFGVILVIVGISSLSFSDDSSPSSKSDAPGFGMVLGIVSVFAGILITAKTASSPTETPIQPVSFTAPETVAPTPTPREPAPSVATANTTATQSYRALCEAQEGWVNLRQRPGFSPIVARIPCNASYLTASGQSVQADGVSWLPVQYGSDRGWVAQTRLIDDRAAVGF